MQTQNPETAAVDAEYAAALADFHAARARLKEAGARRATAHRLVERMRSKEMQDKLGMSDAEWEAEKQFIEQARAIRVEPTVHAAGVS